jgi:predicted peroxiredoxin
MPKTLRVGIVLLLAVAAAALTACSSSSSTKPSDRVLIMLTHGPDPANQTSYTETDLWEINLAVSLANRALAAHRPATLFLDVHGPALARKDLDPTLHFQSEPPIKTQLADFVSKGGTVMICPLCAQVMGVKAQDVIPGVIFDDAGIFGTKGLAPGTTSLSF